MESYGSEKYATSTGAVSSGTMLARTASEVDVPRVSHEMGTIQKLLVEQGELADTVEQRLHAVLRPATEKASGEQGVPRPVTSPLACDLEAFRQQLSRLASHYHDILDRLEV